MAATLGWGTAGVAVGTGMGDAGIRRVNKCGSDACTNDGGKTKGECEQRRRAVGDSRPKLGRHCHWPMTSTASTRANAWANTPQYSVVTSHDFEVTTHLLPSSSIKLRYSFAEALQGSSTSIFNQSRSLCLLFCLAKMHAG